MNTADQDDAVPTMTTLSLPENALARVRDEAANLPVRRPRLHPAMLSGAHNPWGYTGQLLDSWSVLELCESPALLDVVAELIGQDIVLWDSALLLPSNRAADLRRLTHEPSFWPADPLAGALVLIDLTRAVSGSSAAVLMYDVREVGASMPSISAALHTAGSWLCVRYMPATSLFNRDPAFAANRAMANQDPLINYTNRPIWLARGTDHAGSDFVTGFNVTTPSWAPV